MAWLATILKASSWACLSTHPLVEVGLVSPIRCKLSLIQLIDDDVLIGPLKCLRQGHNLTKFVGVYELRGAKALLQRHEGDLFPKVGGIDEGGIKALDVVPQHLL